MQRKARLRTRPTQKPCLHGEGGRKDSDRIMAVRSETHLEVKIGL